MAENELIIPEKKYRGETAVVSARLPKSMIDDLDQESVRTGYNRNEIIAICLEFALKHLKKEEES